MNNSKELISICYQKNLDRAIIKNLIRVNPDTELLEAIKLLYQPGQCCLTSRDDRSENSFNYPQSNRESIEHRYVDCSCLFVVDRQQLVGVITERDLVKIAAQNITLATLKVAEVITGNVLTLKQSDFLDIFTVLNLFSQHKIRHLPIIDAQDQLIGVVTPQSIRQVMQPTDLLKWRRVKEMMTQVVISASPTTSLKELAQLMANQTVSCVVITEEKTPEKSRNCKDSEPDQSTQNQSIQIPVGI